MMSGRREAAGFVAAAARHEWSAQWFQILRRALHDGHWCGVGFWGCQHTCCCCNYPSRPASEESNSSRTNWRVVLRTSPEASFDLNLDRLAFASKGSSRVGPIRKPLPLAGVTAVDSKPVLCRAPAAIGLQIVLLVITKRKGQIGQHRSFAAQANHHYVRYPALPVGGDDF